MNIRRGEKGITLVALVVTIIVLLILAGVTIAMVLGKNGIFNKATVAAEKTNESQELEQVRLAVLEARTNYLTGDKSKTYKEELEASMNKVYPGTTVTENGDGSYTILSNGNKYKVEANGNVIKEGEVEPAVGTKLVDMFIKGESCNAVDCKDPNHLHVGDYVNYTPNSGKSSVTVGTDKTGYTGKATIENGKTDQTYTVDKNTTWRVLGLSEDRKHVLLISGSPLKKDGDYPYLILEGAAGYYYCEDTLSEICSIYHNPNLAEETRSIRIEDINHAVGVVVDKENNKVYKKGDPDKRDITVFNSLGIFYQYKIGDYAPENYLGIGEKTSKDIVPEAKDKSYYMYIAGILDIDTNSKIYEVLFKGTEEKNKCAKAYWLASTGISAETSPYYGPGIIANSEIYNGGAGIFSSTGEWASVGLGVRPIISLKFTVTDSQVSKRSDIEQEPVWDYDLSNPGINLGKYTGEKGKITK